MIRGGRTGREGACRAEEGGVSCRRGVCASGGGGRKRQHASWGGGAATLRERWGERKLAELDRWAGRVDEEGRLDEQRRRRLVGRGVYFGRGRKVELEPPFLGEPRKVAPRRRERGGSKEQQ